MGKKRPLENPPPVSSVEEDDDELTDSDQNELLDGAESGDRQPYPENNSDSELEGTPQSPSLSGFTIRPVVSDLMATVKRKKNPSSNSGTNRIVSESETDESKTKKRKKVPVEDPATGVDGEPSAPKTGSGAVQRLWSRDDEIAILKGMDEYKSKTGSDPISVSSSFYEFIKDSFHVEVSKNQLIEKIRRLKKKFRINIEKDINNLDPNFTNSYDGKIFDLSKQIWGENRGKEEPSNNDNGNSIGDKKKPKQSKSNKNKKDDVFPQTKLVPAKSDLQSKEMVESKANENVEAEEKAIDDDDVGCVDDDRRNVQSSLDYLDSHCLLGASKSIFQAEISRVGGEKAKALNDKWKKLMKEELEMQMKRINYMGELAKLVLES